MKRIGRREFMETVTWGAAAIAARLTALLEKYKTDGRSAPLK
jgi:hypothetical protein